MNKRNFGRNEGETNPKPRVVAVTGTPSAAQAPDETGVRAVDTEDSPNASSEPGLAGVVLGDGC